MNLMSLCWQYMKCTQAPGEAEAELAYLNRVGIIDAVLSDDVDAFLFGALVVVRKYVFILLLNQSTVSSSSLFLHWTRI